MKRLSIIFALFLLAAIDLCAQQIQPYDAVVKLKRSGVEKGILYHVTDGGIILQRGDSIIAISSAEIKTIKIYASSRPYKYKKIFTYDPWGPGNYEILPNSVVPTRKWGEKDPTLGEEITGHIATAAINGAINLVALPFSAIKSNIFKANINHKPAKFKSVKTDLYFYSINYQLYDFRADLKKISSTVK